MSKIYISYDKVHSIMENISKKVLDVYTPDVIIAVTGGGLIPSRIIRKYIKCDILCVGVKLYNADDTRNSEIVKYQWIDKEQIKDKKILIIDEVDDTRTTIAYVIRELYKFDPKKIGVGIINNKLKEKTTEIPDYCSYFIGENTPDKWIVYPWE